LVPVYRDSAVVLRVTKLGEADRIVTLLTRREGRVRAVAKGVRRTKSRFGSRLEPFSHVDLQLYAGRNLDIVTQAETLDPFGPILVADYSRYTCATAIVETAERLTSEEREPSLRLYLLVVSALRALTETARDPSLVLDAFLLRAMALAGWAPALIDCARCGTPGPHAAFHIASGGLLCPQCRSAGSVGTARPAPAAIELMAALAGGDWGAAEGANGAARREASGLVAALLQWHLERGLRSLVMVDRGSDDQVVVL
jgi:DNA repair protein RecO (recombination protein O)